METSMQKQHLKGDERIVHYPSSIYVNQEPTAVVINHPDLIVHPAPVVFHKPAAVVQNPNYRPNKITTFDERVITTVTNDGNLKPNAINSNQKYVSSYNHFKPFQKTNNIDSSSLNSMIALQETTYDLETTEAQPNYFTHEDQHQSLHSESKVSRFENEETTSDYVSNAQFISSLNKYPNTFSNLENVMQETTVQRTPHGSETAHNNLKSKPMKCNFQEPVNNNYNIETDKHLRSHGNHQFSYSQIGTQSNRIVKPPQIHVLHGERAQQFTEKMVSPYFKIKQQEPTIKSGNKLQYLNSEPINVVPQKNHQYETSNFETRKLYSDIIVDKIPPIHGAEYVQNTGDQYVGVVANKNHQSKVQSTVKQTEVKPDSNSKYVDNVRMTLNRYRSNELRTQDYMPEGQKSMTKNQLFYQYTPQKNQQSFAQHLKEHKFQTNNKDVKIETNTINKSDRQLVKESDNIVQQYRHTKEPEPVMYKRKGYGDKFFRNEQSDSTINEFTIQDDTINTQSHKYDDYMIYQNYLKTRDNRNPQFEIKYKEPSDGEKQYSSRKTTEEKIDRKEIKNHVANEISSSDLHIDVDPIRHTTVAAASIHQPIVYYGQYY